MLVPNAATMLENIGMTVPELMALVTSLAFTTGMYFVFHGVYSLRNIPPIGHSDPPMTLKKCIVFILVGAALLYLPSSVRVGTSTFFSSTIPYGYLTDDTSPFMEFYNTCLNIIALVGTISFIKGLIILTHGPSQHDHHPFGRASAHIVAGIFCINLSLFLNAVFSTLGISGLS